MLEFSSFYHLSIYQLVNEEMKRVLVDLCEAVRFVCSVQFFRMAVLWTLSLIFSYFQLWLDKAIFLKSQAYPHCSPAHTPLMKRPICVVTGGTSGLGAAAAYALSKEGFYVVLAGRCNEKLSKIVKEIKQRQPDAHLKAFQVDMSSFQSILNFKNSLQQWLMDLDTHPSIQLLINNAGILSTSRRFTAEGYDQMIGTNYIGAFSLTNLLLPLLESSSIPSRIVNVSSFTHRCVSDIQVDEETLAGNFSVVSKQYPYAQIYEYTKFCLLLFSYTLHRQQCLVDKSHQLSVIVVDPGVVETNIMREIPPFLSFMAVMVLRVLGLSQSPDTGVHSIIDAALAPPEISGQYFFGGRGRVLKSSSLSYDSILAEKLWSSSRKLFVKQQLAFKEAS